MNDFINRVNPKDINKLQLEGLVKAGAPALTKPSNWSLFISLGFTRLIKSFIDLNFPFSLLSLTIFDNASYPTFLIPPKA